MMQNDQDKIIKEMQSYEKKLQTSSKKYEEIEMKIFHVNRSRERTLFEIEEMKMRNEMLKVRLRNIHENYLSCVIFNNEHKYEEEIRGKFEKLTIEQDNLKERLIECKRSKEENDEKIKELSITIEIEKKRNVALLRKLERASNMKNISQELRDKINIVLTNKSSNEI
ncbi:laminin subunit beta-4 [Vespula squamosa]|uniref:Laminin subunit beta-4 n=1 Tax=Vespula squamosa TaxID=30214 RepID=A0ABD2BS38_VESSQ